MPLAYILPSSPHDSTSLFCFFFFSRPPPPPPPVSLLLGLQLQRFLSLYVSSIKCNFSPVDCSPVCSISPHSFLLLLTCDGDRPFFFLPFPPPPSPPSRSLQPTIILLSALMEINLQPSFSLKPCLVPFPLFGPLLYIFFPVFFFLS